MALSATEIKLNVSDKAVFAVDVGSSIRAGSKEEVQALISAHKVVMFSKSTCPFCFEMKRTLASLGVPYAVVEVDSHPARGTLKPLLVTMTSSKTLPQLFVDGKCIGGCDALKARQHKGDLSFLAPYMSAAPLKEKDNERVHSASPLFWFPHTINNHAARAAGAMTVIYCILCIAFWDRTATPWAVLALAIDFCIRMLWGGSSSPIGVMSAFAVSFLEPQLKTGAPKQFAAFCGLFFSVFASGLYLSDYTVGGAVVLGGLMGAALLETVLDFCLGCWMYGHLINFGIISPHIYRASINLKLDAIWAWRFANADPNTYPKAENQHVLLPGQTEPTQVDLIRKNRLETEYKNKDIDVIRHTKVESFGAPMALAALGYAYHLVGVVFHIDRSKHLGDTLGIMSAVIFCFLALLHIFKLLAYPKKAIKEWNHPTAGNLFSAISICLSLYGLLLYPHHHYSFDQLGIVLVWIGAVFQMLLAVVVVSRLAFDNHHSDEVINPSILMAPVGNYVSAIALASYPYGDGDVNYLFISRLWFSVATLFAVTMFTITFKKSFSDGHQDVRVRPLFWIWQAAASVAGPATFAVSGPGSNLGPTLAYQSFWLIAVFFFAVNAVGWLKGFYSYCQDMSIWVIAFSSAALAMSTVHYYAVVTDGADKFMEVIVYIAMAVASTTCAMCMIYTAMWTFDGTVFKPRQKWGPLTFMKLTHEAFRVCIPQLKNAVASLEPAVPQTAKYFLDQMEPFMVAYVAHAAHEDQVIFPAGRAVFPQLNPGMSEEHHHEHEMLASLTSAMAVLKQSLAGESVDVATAMATLQKGLPLWADHLLAHMRNEEQSITVVVRKYLSIERQKEITRQCYEVTSPADWHVIMPFVLSRLPHPGWKSRFVRTFLWANPERVSEIGLILYRGCDSAVFAALSDEIPALIPRGAHGWQRKY